MSEHNRDRAYAHLPEDLILKILSAVPVSVDKMNKMFDIQNAPVAEGMAALRDSGRIRELRDTEGARSVMAADGGGVLERMSGADLLLAVAVGVEGLSDTRDGWRDGGGNQHYQWQTVLPHEEASARLMQGAMFLMELGVLSGATHEVKIMDGTHFTPILKINSMLSAKEERAGAEYADALREFLRDTYDKIIPDIPDIISAALSDENIVAIVKYSSSRDILDAHVRDQKIALDDKTFFALGLNADEYIAPVPVGQSKQERDKIWDKLHIHCNLEIPERDELNAQLKDAIAPVRTKSYGGAPRESSLYFTYYKPHEDGPAYRVECKKSLATDEKKFERMLSGIKRQIVYPDIREPFPQHLADLMAKSVAGGMHALLDAIRLSPDLSVKDGRFDLILPYRSK